MAQAGEDLPLAGEALAQVGIGEPRAQQFQGDATLVQAVGAARQPDLAHAALAEQAVELVRADQGVGLGHRRRRHQRLGEEVLVVLFQRQQRFDLGRQRRILLAQRVEPRLAGIGFEFDQRVEQRREALPAFGIHRRGVGAWVGSSSHAPQGRARCSVEGQRSPFSSPSDASRNMRAFCQSRRMLRSERFISSAISCSDRPAK